MHSGGQGASSGQRVVEPRAHYGGGSAVVNWPSPSSVPAFQTSDEPEVADRGELFSRGRAQDQEMSLASNRLRPKSSRQKCRCGRWGSAEKPASNMYADNSIYASVWGLYTSYQRSLSAIHQMVMTVCGFSQQQSG